MTDSRPITRGRGGGYVLHLGSEERALLSGLLDELRTLLTSPEPAPTLRRLRPVVHPDHPDREAEYQRLMGDELLASRLAGLDAVQEVLATRGRKVALDEGQLLAFMQALNSVRLVLGTILDVREDDDMAIEDASAEHHLYGYLSYLVDSAVTAAAP